MNGKERAVPSGTQINIWTESQVRTMVPTFTSLAVVVIDIPREFEMGQEFLAQVDSRRGIDT